MKNEFYNKAKEYAIGRPSYPKEILNKIRELGILKESIIADVGAGTGLLTHVLCNLGCNVFAVEPNSEMISECKKYCSNDTNIKYICAPAEATEFKDNSIDIITVAQAFHWFDRKLCKVEFQRILKENGYVITLWNAMENDSEFINEYIDIIGRYEIKTTAGNSDFYPDKEKLEFFGQEYTKIYYDNVQTLIKEEIICNALSISYTPSKSDKEYKEFNRELLKLFSMYEENGKVTVHYKTEVCIGQFKQEGGK